MLQWYMYSLASIMPHDMQVMQLCSTTSRLQRSKDVRQQNMLRLVSFQCSLRAVTRFMLFSRLSSAHDLLFRHQAVHSLGGSGIADLSVIAPAPSATSRSLKVVPQAVPVRVVVVQGERVARLPRNGRSSLSSSTSSCHPRRRRCVLLIAGVSTGAT